MIGKGCSFTIQYIDNGFIQNKRIVTDLEIEEITKNKEHWKTLDIKAKVPFEKKNKCWLNFGEVHPDSLLGGAIIGKTTGNIVTYMAPVNQGNKEIKIVIL